MEIRQVHDALVAKARELEQGQELTWRYPKTPPKDPLRAKPTKSWQILDDSTIGTVLKKNEKNWLYSEIEFPKTKNGIKIEGAEAWFFLYGWMPFTLWMDGEEIFKETHAWHATGPIADPVVKKIEPGKKYRFVACIEPTEIPAGSTNPLPVIIRYKPCIDAALPLSSAAFQVLYADALATSLEDKKSVQDAAYQIDLDALNNNKWGAVMESIGAMEAEFEWLRERAHKHTMHIIGHTHIDMDWMWTWSDTVSCVRRDFKAVTDIMDDFSDVTFTVSQVPSYEVVKNHDPAVFKKIQKYVKEGRWESAAGTWVEGDLNMSDGESIARHMLYAADWGEKNLGKQAKVLWEPDTFGHPGNMPQLAKLGEHDCYFHWRGNPGKNDNWPIRIWEGVDGTPITAFSTAYGSGLMPDHMIWNLLSAVKFNLQNSFHVWGMGDHGGGLPRFYLDMIKGIIDKPVAPTFKFSTMENLLKAVKKEKTKLPGNKGFTFNLFEGCFTTHASIKRYNRHCETAMLTAEALAALAGDDKRTALKDAWTKMLFNHFHDIFDGAAVHDSYIDAHQRAEDCLQTAEKVTKGALKALVKPARGGKKLVLINQLGFIRTEPVTVELPKTTRCLIDEDGVAVPVQQKDDAFVFIAEGVPAFGMKAYEISTKAPAELDAEAIAVNERDHDFVVDSPMAKAHVLKGSGAIGYYYDKFLDKEFVSFGLPKTLTHVQNSRADLTMNVFQIIDEAPVQMSAWLINDLLKQENLLRGAEVNLVESGPVFARFKVAHKFRSSTIDEDIVFYKDFPRVDFTAVIDWREKGSKQTGAPQLKVAFGSGMSAGRVRSEGPFVVNELPADGMDYPTQKWVDLSGDEFGFALFNDSKYAYDALGGRLRLTLLRNGYEPDPETDNGVHTINFAFVPHAGDAASAELIRQSSAYNRPAVAVRTNAAVAASQPVLKMDGADSVVCTALRRAEHSERLLVRFFESSGQDASVTFSMADGIKSAEEVNFLENPTAGELKVTGGKVKLDFHPFEVKTILLECKGLA